ncbi:hypothetical protein EDD36DRAFT_226504 [Exophiala viscosa]|uniref:Uncharacterized protein n=1 Tax=Exophiala viscosa TaxID=2486360 RepID=A0AAN6IDZ4_9EURO|nr:hypothetical protein EDD36DRAFT_226504 [Exophiala viscosa]
MDQSNLSGASMPFNERLAQLSDEFKNINDEFKDLEARLEQSKTSLQGLMQKLSNFNVMFGGDGKIIKFGNIGNSELVKGEGDMFEEMAKHGVFVPLFFEHQMATYAHAVETFNRIPLLANTLEFRVVIENKTDGDEKGEAKVGEDPDQSRTTLGKRFLEGLRELDQVVGPDVASMAKLWLDKVKEFRKLAISDLRDHPDLMDLKRMQVVPGFEKRRRKGEQISVKRHSCGGTRKFPGPKSLGKQLLDAEFTTSEILVRFDRSSNVRRQLCAHRTSHGE